jgi:hypothetical protein
MTPQSAGALPPDDTDPDDTRTRTDLAIRWVAWHSLELTTVTAPLILAITVDAWLALGSVLAGAVWTATEWRRHTERRDIRTLPTGTADPVRQLTTTPAPDRRDDSNGASA